MSELSKILIFAGVVLVVVGLAVALLGKIPGVGRLPGDILIKKENFTFYFPLTTSILVSIILSLIFFLCRQK